MKKIIGIVLCVIMSVSFVACNVQPRMGSGDIVIATSEGAGVELLLRDYLYILASNRMQHEQMLMQMLGMGWDELAGHWGEPLGDTGVTMFTGLKEMSLNEAKATVLLYTIAKEHGFSYDPEIMSSIREEMQEMVRDLNSPDTVGARVFYEFYYVTYQERLEVYRMLLTMDAFRMAMFENTVVSEADARAFYDNPANFDEVEDQRSMTVAHILITFGEDPTEDDEVHDKAEEILARIRAGESFAALVEEYSQDLGSIPNEGRYTITRNTNFVPEFMEWTLAAQIDDTGIVETDHGLHIMHMVARDTFDDMMVVRETLDGPLHPFVDALRVHFFTDAVDALINERNADDWVVDEALYDSITHNIYDRTQRR